MYTEKLASTEISVLAQGRRYYVSDEVLLKEFLTTVNDVGGIGNFDVVRHLYFRFFDTWNFHAILSKIKLATSHALLPH